ncbi:hypothetical protein ABK040_015639 [Willaertia magna]
MLESENTRRKRKHNSTQSNSSVNISDQQQQIFNLNYPQVKIEPSSSQISTSSNINQYTLSSITLVVPFCLKSVPIEILSIGEIHEINPSYSYTSIERYWRKFKGDFVHPYPIGYKSILKLDSAKTSKSFIMEVKSSELGPVFQITDLQNQNVYEGNSCSQPWKEACKLYPDEKFIEELTGVRAFGFCDEFLITILNQISIKLDKHLPSRANRTTFMNLNKYQWIELLKTAMEQEKKEIEEMEKKLVELRKQLLEEQKKSETVTDETFPNEILNNEGNNHKIDNAEDNKASPNGTQTSPKEKTNSVNHSMEEEDFPKLRRRRRKQLSNGNSQQSVSTSDSLKTPNSIVFDNSSTKLSNSTISPNCSPSLPTPLVGIKAIDDNNSPTLSSSSEKRKQIEKTSPENSIKKLKLTEEIMEDDEKITISPVLRRISSSFPSQESTVDDSDTEEQVTKLRDTLFNMPKSPKVKKLTISPSKNLNTPLNEDSSPVLQPNLQMDESKTFIAPSLPSQKKPSQSLSQLTNKVDTEIQPQEEDNKDNKNDIPEENNQNEKSMSIENDNNMIDEDTTKQETIIEDKQEKDMVIEEIINEDELEKTPEELPQTDMENIFTPKKESPSPFAERKTPSSSPRTQNIVIQPTIEINFADDIENIEDNEEMKENDEKEERKAIQSVLVSSPVISKPSLSIEETTVDNLFFGNGKLTKEPSSPIISSNLNNNISKPSLNSPESKEIQEDAPQFKTPPRDESILRDEVDSQQSDNVQPSATPPPAEISNIITTSFTSPNKNEKPKGEREELVSEDEESALMDDEISTKEEEITKKEDEVSTDEEFESPRTPHTAMSVSGIIASPILSQVNQKPPPFVSSPPIVHPSTGLVNSPKSPESIPKVSKIEIEPTIAIDFDEGSPLMDEATDDEKQIPEENNQNNNDHTVELTNPTNIEITPPSSPILTTQKKPPVQHNIETSPVLQTKKEVAPPFTPPRMSLTQTPHTLPNHPIEKINKQFPLKPYNKFTISSSVINMMFAPKGEPRLAICTKTDVSVRELTGMEWIETELFQVTDEEQEEYFYVHFTSNAEYLIVAGSQFEPSMTMTLMDLESERSGSFSYQIKFYELDGLSIGNQSASPTTNSFKKQECVLSLSDHSSEITTMQVFTNQNVLLTASKSGEFFKHTFNTEWRKRTKFERMESLPQREPINSIELVKEMPGLIVGVGERKLGIWNIDGKLLKTLNFDSISIVRGSVLQAITTGNNQGIFLVCIHRELQQQLKQTGLFFFNEIIQQLHVYKRKDASPSLSQDNMIDNVTCIDTTRYTDKATYLVQGTENGKLIIYNYRNANTVGILVDMENERIGACCFHTTYPLLAVGGERNVIIYYQDK